jgi:hypothetical protein
MYYLFDGLLIAQELANINETLQKQGQRFFKLPSPWIEMNEQSFGDKTRAEIDQFLTEIKSTSVALRAISFSAEQTSRSYDSRNDTILTEQEMKKWDLVVGSAGPQISYLDKWGMEHSESTWIQSISIVKLENQIALYVRLKGENTQVQYDSQYLLTPYHYEMTSLQEFEKETRRDRREIRIITSVLLSFVLIFLFIIPLIVCFC